MFYIFKKIKTINKYIPIFPLKIKIITVRTIIFHQLPKIAFSCVIKLYYYIIIYYFTLFILIHLRAYNHTLMYYKPFL